MLTILIVTTRSQVVGPVSHGLQQGGSQKFNICCGQTKSRAEDPRLVSPPVV
jgi:hypothetical protein